MTRILLIVAGLILYGSLYPWAYRPGPVGTSAVQVLLHSWPKKIAAPDLGDIVVNIVLYMPVGIFAFFALDRSRHQWLRWFVPGLIGLVLSTSIELLQVFDKTRDPSLLDVLDNTLGAIIGTVIGFAFRDSFSGAIFLVFYWLGFQISALFGIIAGKRSPPKFLASPLETVTATVAWGLVLYLLSTSRQHNRKTKLAVALAAGFTLLLVVRGLSPFHFQPHPSPFSWIPFWAMFQSEWIVGLPIFLEKSFYYGAAIWLMHAAGLRLSHASAAVAGVLAAIELMQRYLPGRTAETTDPVLALILGFILSKIEQDYNRISKHEYDHLAGMQPVRETV